MLYLLSRLLCNRQLEVCQNSIVSCCRLRHMSTLSLVGDISLIILRPKKEKLGNWASLGHYSELHIFPYKFELNLDQQPQITRRWDTQITHSRLEIIKLQSIQNTFLNFPTGDDPHMTSAKCCDFFYPSPLVCIYSASDSYHKIHTTFLTTSIFVGPTPPPSADVICGWSLSMQSWACMSVCCRWPPQRPLITISLGGFGKASTCSLGNISWLAL